MNRAAFHAAVFFTALALWTYGLLTPVPHKEAEQVLGGSEPVFWFGKTLHVCVYATLTLLGGSMRLTRAQRWLLLGLMSAHGFITEFLQQFVEGRTGCLRDVGLDHIGIILGLLAGWRWWRGLRPEPSQEMA
jgi:VanZ family protein